MTIRQRGDSYQVDLGSGKNRVRRSFKTYAEAQQAESEYAIAMASSGVSSTTPQDTLAGMLRVATMSTWRGTRSGPKLALQGQRVVETLGATTHPRKVDARAIDAAIAVWAEAGNSGATINRKLSALSVLLKHAQRYGLIDRVPDLPKQREATHRIRWMDGVEEARVLTACEELGLTELKHYVVIGVEVGLRASEQLRLEGRDLVGHHLHIGPGKTHRPRTLPLENRAADLLAFLAERSGPSGRIFPGLTYATVRRQWEMVRRTLRMESDPQFVIHMLRHTCASRMVQMGIPLALIQQWLGHTNIATTMRYAHLAPDSLERVRELRGNAPRTPQTGHLRVVGG